MYRVVVIVCSNIDKELIGTRRPPDEGNLIGRGECRPRATDSPDGVLVLPEILPLLRGKVTGWSWSSSSCIPIRKFPLTLADIDMRWWPVTGSCPIAGPFTIDGTIQRLWSMLNYNTQHYRSDW